MTIISNLMSIFSKEYNSESIAYQINKKVVGIDRNYNATTEGFLCRLEAPNLVGLIELNSTKKEVQFFLYRMDSDQASLLLKSDSSYTKTVFDYNMNDFISNFKKWSIKLKKESV